MESQLKGGRMVKWNEVFNGLPRVIINEMGIWLCMWPSGKTQTKLSVNGFRRRMLLQKERSLSLLALSPIFPGKEAALRPYQVTRESLEEAEQVTSWHPWRKEVLLLLNTSFWWATCNCAYNVELLFMTILIRVSDLLQGLFCTVTFFERCLQTKEEENSTMQAGLHAQTILWLSFLAHHMGSWGYKNCLCLIKHKSLWTPWGFFSAYTFL